MTYYFRVHQINKSLELIKKMLIVQFMEHSPSKNFALLYFHMTLVIHINLFSPFFIKRNLQNLLMCRIRFIKHNYCKIH